MSQPASSPLSGPATPQNLQSSAPEHKADADSVVHVDPAPAGSSNDTQQPVTVVREVGGRGGLEPTRYGDWEKNGRCIDF